MSNKFDRIMDYIDVCVSSHLEDEEIQAGIYDLIRYKSNVFSDALKVLTGESLLDYIRRRRFYFAAQQLKNPKNGKRVLDIAVECGYSENATFTRRMQYYYGCTPTDIREGKADIPNDKLRLKDLCNKNPDTRASEIIKAIELGTPLSFANEELMGEMYQITKEYCVDIDIGYAAMDIAEKLGVSPIDLLHNILNYAVEEKLATGYLPPAVEYAMDCGILTEKDAKAICHYYSCSLYDLNPQMVQQYYAMSTKPSKDILEDARGNRQ